MTHSYPWSRVLIFFNRSHESNEHIPFATSEARLSLMADIWSSVNTLLIRSKSDSSISSLTGIKYFEGSGLKYSGAWVLRKNSSQTKFPLRSHSLWWSHAWLLSTLTSRISVRSHLFFFELLETGFCLIWVVTLIFFKDIWKFAQQFIQILSVFHAESPNVRLKIAIFSTFTLYLNFKLNVWAKR